MEQNNQPEQKTVIQGAIAISDIRIIEALIKHPFCDSKEYPTIIDEAKVPKQPK